AAALSAAVRASSVFSAAASSILRRSASCRASDRACCALARAAAVSADARLTGSNDHRSASAAVRALRVCSMRVARGAGVAAGTGRAAAVLAAPGSALTRPVAGDALGVVVGDDGLEGEVVERLEVAELVAGGVPEPGDAVAAGRDEPAVLGEADRGDAAV